MQNKKTALVTGASSGIGKAIFSKLIDSGWVVYGTSRKIEKGNVKEVSGGFMIHMDVTDESSIDSAYKIIKEKEGGLDALINNAGNGIAGAVEDTSAKEAMWQFDVNYFGMLRTVRAFFDMLMKKEGIIINVSSVAGVLSIPFQGQYSASKAALEAASEALRMEVKPYGVRVCLVEPGDTKTEFTQNRTWSEAAEGSRYEKTMKASIQKMEHDEQNGVSPAKVAEVVWKMMQKKNPPVRKAVGLSYQILIFLKRLLPDKLVLWILGKMYA